MPIPEHRESGCIVLVSKAGLQTHLIAQFIGGQDGLTCVQVEPDDPGSMAERAADLVLLDFNCLSGEQSIKDWFAHPAVEKASIALMNVVSSAKLDRWMEQGNLMGVFRDTDNPEVVLKGVRSILQGQLWFPRTVMDSFVRYSRQTARNGERDDATSVALQPDLTRSEQRVLEALSRGANNDQIADRLNVTTHTVKTHLSNLYRKLSVTNRVEAALWARRAYSDREN
ncbi:MAG: response regulator transcription factor [Pseudomonadota bacterium]